MKTIIIDGVEYTLVPGKLGKSEPQVEIDVIRTEGRTIESSEYCFEATRIERNDAPGTYYDGIDIKFTDKRQNPWKEDYWDNDTWMQRVLEGNPDALYELNHLCPQGIAEFKAFLKVLKEEEWL